MGSRFSAPVQMGCEAHAASYTVGTYRVLPGCKAAGEWRGVDHPPPSSTEVKESRATILIPFRSSWAVLGCTLPFTHNCKFYNLNIFLCVLLSQFEDDLI